MRQLIKWTGVLFAFSYLALAAEPLLAQTIQDLKKIIIVQQAQIQELKRGMQNREVQSKQVISPWVAPGKKARFRVLKTGQTNFAEIDAVASHNSDQGHGYWRRYYVICPPAVHDQKQKYPYCNWRTKNISEKFANPSGTIRSEIKHGEDGYTYIEIENHNDAAGFNAWVRVSGAVSLQPEFLEIVDR